ncbi:MAG: phosphatase PAP2 family protein, partial [Pseudolabrys sp.]
AALDRALGIDWVAYFHFMLQWPALLPALSLGYAMIGWPVFGIPAVLGWTGRYRRLQQFTLAFALALIATTAISTLVPALGTYDQLGIKVDPAVFTSGAYISSTHDMALIHNGTLRQLDIFHLVGIVTFPSFHACSAVLYLWGFWAVRWMRPIALLSNGVMLLATPIGGAHYFVDLFAGVAVAVLAIAAAKWLSARLTQDAGAPAVVMPGAAVPAE